MNTIEANALIAGNGDESDQKDQASRNSIAKRLLAFIHGLDAEFPLSGGETNQELSKNIQYLEQEGAIFVHSAHHSFPLTGA